MHVSCDTLLIMVDCANPRKKINKNAGLNAQHAQTMPSDVGVKENGTWFSFKNSAFECHPRREGGGHVHCAEILGYLNIKPAVERWRQSRPKQEMI